jgi:hypothetical protein
MSGSNSSNPAEPLADPVQLSVHAMPRLDLAPQRRTTVGRWKMLLVLLVCAAPVIASYLSYYVIRPQGRSNYADLIEPARVLPASLPLQDLDGRAVDPRTLLGQWLLVVIAPAACNSDCEKRLFAQRQLREMTGRERDRIDKLWLITDDAPLRPELRAALATTPATQVLRVPSAVLATWLEAAPGESLESHLYVVDPMGRWMMRAPATLDASKFKRDLERVLRASVSWDQAGR